LKEVSKNTYLEKKIVLLINIVFTNNNHSFDRMRFQTFILITSIVLGLFDVAFTSDSSAKPQEEERFLFSFPTGGTAINSLLGIGLAAGAGLLLGRALGGIGRGNIFGRRQRYGGFGGFGGFPRFRPFGKREQGNDFDDPFDTVEENLISDMFELMISTDPDDCYRRLICDIASRDKNFTSFHPFLKFASDDEDLFVPLRFLEYSDKLKSARKVGEKAETHHVCEDTYQCPHTGLEISETMKEKFQEEINDSY